MRLYALADLHLRYEVTRRALQDLRPHPYDWLILAGDVGETEEHLRFALAILAARFARLLWVPGNHDLWTIPTRPGDLRGEEKYQRLVAICREFGVLTPEDPYVTWPGEGPRCILAPLFLLYDYTFRPDDVPVERAVEWAAEENLLCSDEVLLHSDPHLSKPDWCHARVRVTAPRLAEAAERGPLVIINHFPLRQDLAVLPRIPRFSIWCGTRETEDWHLRYRAEAVVYGHLHIRATHHRDGVRFEEVSLGYPQNWDAGRGIDPYLRLILPHPKSR
ncbi:MAG TPA: metallophosphoesterase [Thermoanaerobaculia bacterium]|jgi:predicted phosphodiesterase|nr:metallophosphoesterase [Thermoanaerobaculia bacterium]